MNSDLNFFKKNGYLVKKNLITQKKINNINKIVNEVVTKENRKNKRKDTNGTQSYEKIIFPRGSPLIGILNNVYNCLLLIL